MSLSISIPEKKVSAWMAETTVAETNHWLSRLPIADSLESGRDLYQALYTLNRMQLAPKNRLELMELYRLPVSQVTGQLQNRLASASYPLSLQKFRLAEFVRDLQVEMAYGYKLALYDTMRAKRPVWGKSSVQAKTIFRSLHYLGNTLLRSISCYLPFPKNVWKEIHSLYQYAESLKCQTEAVDEFDAESNRQSTIEKRYKEILLLGLAGPYQMPLGQYRNVNNYIYRWADLAELAPIRSDQKSAPGIFLVQPEKDSPATSLARIKPEDIDSGSSSHLLNATTLLDHVQSMLRQIETGTPTRNLDLGGECLEEAAMDMLRQLVRAWKGNPWRHAARIPMSGEVSICCGLSSIHRYVHRQQLDQNRQSSAADIGGAPVLLSRQDSAAETRDNGAITAVKTEKWEFKNASSGGALLRGPENSGVSVRVGDVVALADTGADARAKLFSVRWMKELGAKGLEVGLELMSSEVSSVLVGQERGAGSYVPGLMLEKINTKAKKLPRTLVLQKNLRGKQKDIELVESDDAGTKWIRVLEVIDKTNAYERISFVNLSRRDK